MQINSISIGFSEIPNNISVLFYAQGCKHHCLGCHNEELWEFSGGTYYTDDDIRKKMEKYKNVCNWVCWLGGDAVFQPKRLVEISNICKEMGFKVALYTGFKKSELDAEILDCIDVLVDGKWDSTLGGVESDTTNQRVFKKCENKKLKEIKFKDLV